MAIHQESQFQRAIVKYLRLRNIFCFSVPNGVHLTTIQSRIAVAEGLLHGVSDLIVITPKEAYFEYGSMRLGAVIFELRKNHKIRTNMIDVAGKYGNSTVAQYIYEGAI